MYNQIDYWNKCIFCGNTVKPLSRAPEFTNDEYLNRSCPRCNQYSLYKTTIRLFQNITALNEKQRLIISNEIYNNIQVPEIITCEKMEKFDKLQDKDTLFKINSLLLYLCDTIKTEIDNFDFNDIKYLSMRPASWICGDDELKYCFKSLFDGKYLIKTNPYTDDSFGFKITIKWHEHANNFRNNLTIKNSNQVFIAMWFDKCVDFLSDYLHSIVKEFKLNPLRIDEKIHNNNINNEIISEIKKSKFLIADLTGNRGGVYYEIGYAHALKIPVIITSDNKNKQDTHFDVKPYNCIFWEEDKLEIFANILREHIAKILSD